MSEWFHVGQKVVCVNAGPYEAVLPDGEDPAGLAEGAIYTVRWIGPYHYKGIGTFLSVRLNEYKRDAGDCPVGAVRFRPLRKRTTSIEIFKQLLVTPPKEVERV